MPEVYFVKQFQKFIVLIILLLLEGKKCSYMTMELNLYFTGYIDHILGLAW